MRSDETPESPQRRKKRERKVFAASVKKTLRGLPESDPPETVQLHVAASLEFQSTAAVSLGAPVIFYRRRRKS